MREALGARNVQAEVMLAIDMGEELVATQFNQPYSLVRKPDGKLIPTFFGTDDDAALLNAVSRQGYIKPPTERE